MWLIAIELEVEGAAVAVTLALIGAIAAASLLEPLWLLIPASSIAIPLLVLASFTEANTVPPPLGQAVAGAATTFAVALAIDRFDGVRHERIPTGIVFAGAAVAFAGSAYNTESLWLTIAIALTVSGLVLDALLDRSSDRRAYVPPRPSLRLAVSGALAISTGSAGIAILLALGNGTGWTITGAISAGLLGLTVRAGMLILSERERSDRLLHIARESRIDGLTGLLNRRGIDERLAEEAARATRYGHELSVLMIDLDDFKAINDRYGHAAGDEALRSTAGEIADAIRSIDVAGRYGGEEFLVLLPETGAAGALVVAERIRTALEAGGHTTVSLGAATHTNKDASPSALVERADSALYAAKRSGKNKTVLSD
jgi:diguanylate cyclase (GGDEF)-like protein